MSQVEIPPWTPPWRVVVRDRLIRVSAAHVRGEERWECPTQIAVKARPTLQVDRDPSVRPTYPPYHSFALGLARDAAYTVMASGTDPEVALDQVCATSSGDVADAARTVAREALQGYLIAVARLRDTGELPTETVVREFFAVDEIDVRIEWSAWGLMHVSRDGAVREFHVLTWEQAGARRREPAYLAVYARVAADALMKQEGSIWRERWAAATSQPGPAQRVRVREIGMLDASDALLLDITAEEARARFSEQVSERVQVLGGGAFNPGSRCASCAVRYECPGVARMPGVLGVAGPALWTRALSPGDLTTARTCTWQVHLERELSLPRARRETTEAMVRGTHLHTWLEHAHARLVACTPDDLPLPSEGLGEVAELLGWDEATYMALRPYLLQHISACPLHREDVVAAYPEQSLTAWDTDVDVVMSTRTDLVVETGAGYLVRETKSVGAHHEMPQTAAEVFERYPQVAVALCLLADGLDPVTGAVSRDARPARVEVEILRPDGHEVRGFDTSDAEAVLMARATIAEAIDTILYLPAEPHVGRHCSWCPVSRWCVAYAGDAPTTAGEAEPGVDGERPRMSLLAYAEAVSIETDSDMPF
ncbi:MAG: hypothetical protein RLZ94_1894 [Actinomycetota bacterium]